MTQPQKFGMTLLALGIWIATAASIPDARHDRMVMWMIGGGMLIFGVWALARCD